MVETVPYLVPRDESITESLTTRTRPQLPQEVEMQQQKKVSAVYGPQVYAEKVKLAMDSREQVAAAATPTKAQSDPRYKHVSS